MSASMTMWKFRSNLLAFLGHAFLLLFAPGNMYVALVGAAVCPPDGNSTAWVDCRNGVAFESGASTGTTCKDACGGQCCFDSVYPSSEAPCLNATACIKKDGSYNGDDACKSLAFENIGGGKPVISGPSCVGESACLRLGYDATAVPDFITKSCTCKIASNCNACVDLGTCCPRAMHPAPAVHSVTLLLARLVLSMGAATTFPNAAALLQPPCKFASWIPALSHQSVKTASLTPPTPSRLTVFVTVLASA